MAFEQFAEALVERNEDGSVQFITTGGVDPSFSADEASALAAFLTGQASEEQEAAATAAAGVAPEKAAKRSAAASRRSEAVE